MTDWATGMVDHIDSALLARLQADATQPYTALGQAVGLSAAAAHERVRKLKERGVIRRTTVDVDPAAVGRGVLAFVLLDTNAWMGDSGPDFAGIPQIVEAHVVAGPSSILLKVRTGTTEELQAVLRRLFAVPGVSGTQTIVVLESLVDRPVAPA